MRRASIWLLLGSSLAAFGQSIVADRLLRGSGNDNGAIVVTDRQGFVYVAGLTTSEDFPTTPGAFQPKFQQPSYLGEFTANNFVVKLDPTLSKIVFATYIGPAIPNGISAMTVDSSGNVYVVGTTQSHNFPTTVGAMQHTFASSLAGYVAKISADGGQLLYSTFLDGLQPSAISVDSNGVASIAGSANAGALPVTPGAIQPGPPKNCSRPIDFLSYPKSTSLHGFVAKLAASGGSLQLATYLSGACGDTVKAVTTDSAGAIIVAGETYSEDFPVTPDAMTHQFPGVVTSGFISEINATGDTLLYSTFFGGGFFTSANAIALDSQGSFIVAGNTQTTATPGAFSTPPGLGCPPVFGFGPGSFSQSPINGDDAFALKLKPGSSTPVFLATFGGSCGDGATSLAVDPSGNLWMTGRTASSDFSTRAPFAGLGDINSTGAFLAELSSDGSDLLFAKITGGGSVAIAPSGAVYHAGSFADSSKSPASPYLSYSTVAVAQITGGANPPISLDKIVSLHQTQGNPPWYLPTLIAPGQIVSVKGRGIGPREKAEAKLTAGGRLDTSIGGVRVTFNGVAAPIVMAQADEIVCITPFALDGKTSADVQVEFDEKKSNVYPLAVAPQSADFIAISNADGSPNSLDNRAALGSIVTLYVTGLGQTNPPGVDGAIIQNSNIQPVKPPLITSAGYSLLPTYLGSAPGEVAGVTQINLLAVDPGASNNLAVYVNSAFGRVYIAKP